MEPCPRCGRPVAVRPDALPRCGHCAGARAEGEAGGRRPGPLLRGGALLGLLCIALAAFGFASYSVRYTAVLLVVPIVLAGAGVILLATHRTRGSRSTHLLAPSAGLSLMVLLAATTLTLVAGPFALAIVVPLLVLAGWFGATGALTAPGRHPTPAATRFHVFVGWLTFVGSVAVGVWQWWMLQHVSWT